MALIKSFIPSDLLDSVRQYDDKLEKPAEPNTDYSYIKLDGMNRIAGWVENTQEVKEEVEQIDELNLTGYVDAAKASAAKMSKQGDSSAKRGNYEAAYKKFSKSTKRLASVAKAEKRIAAQKWRQTIGEGFQAVQPQPQRGPTQVEMDKAQEHIKKNHPGMKLNGVAIDPNGKINVKAVKVVNDVVEQTESDK